MNNDDEDDDIDNDNEEDEDCEEEGEVIYRPTKVSVSMKINRLYSEAGGLRGGVACAIADPGCANSWGPTPVKTDFFH